MKSARHSVWGLVLLVCFCMLAVPVQGQYRAGVQGTVTDTTGGVIKAVKVTVTSQETGKVYEVTSNDTGFYSVTNLPPGKYTIKAEIAGFKARVVKDVAISAESTEGVDVVLEAGAVTEQVVVSGDTAGALQTEDASLTGTVTNAQVQNLPQFRGDPYELLRITPGVFGQGARSSNGDSANLPGYNGVGGSNRSVFQIENAVQVSANGSRVEANGYQLDGVSTNSQGWGGATVITPNAESVKEVKVEVSPYSAENSHGAGAIVQVVSQNGTNDLHGSAVLRIHSPGLNAFQRWGGPNGASPNRDNQNLHNILGSLGGPILKNKLFAFFSFEHMKVAGSSYRAQSWAETSQWISKLPSGSLAAKIFAVQGSGFTNPRILPATPTGGSSCAGLGMAEGTSCRTVTGGVDLGSNTGSKGTIVNAGTGGGLDGSPDVALVEYDAFNDNIGATQYNGRVDFQATKKDLVAFSLFYVPVKKSFLPGGWIDGRQYDLFNTDGLNDTAALLWNRTISPSTINEARMNVTRWYFDEITSNPQAPFGVPIVNINIPQNSVGAGFSLGPGLFYQTTYVFRDTLSKVYNSHVLKFGGEIAREQNNSANTRGARPTYDFNNLWSFANDAPIDQGFGTYDPKTGAPTDFRKYIRVETYGFFGQDTWKVKPNLTLTLGLRYDYFTPLHEKFGRLSNIILGTGTSTLTGAKIRRGGDFTQPDRNNFGPQIGFVWSPRKLLNHDFENKFVLRSGVGVAYNRVQENLLLNASGNPPDFIATGFPTSEVVYGFSSGGNYSFSGFPANPAAILTFDPNTGLPIGGEHLAKPNIQGPVQNLATPYTWHFSMEGQYDLGHNWVAAVSYQGSQSRKYPRSLNYALLYPQNTNIGSVTIFETDVNSRYNALLARVMHHSSGGLDFEANYRLSRSMDHCSSDQTCHQTFPFAQSTELGPSDFDATHTFTSTVLYELPFFKSRHDWLYTIAGGWKIGGIFTLNSGFPWTPTVGTCVSNIFGNVCPTRPTAYLGGAGTDFSTSHFQATGGNFPGYATTPVTCTTTTPVTCTTKYFKVVDSPSGTGILPPAPGVGRNVFRGPRYTGLDVSFGKRFTLPRMKVFGESAGFELKANIFNLFNKLNLAPFGFNSGSTNLGSFTSTETGRTFAPNPTFGQATGALGGRVIEFTGKFSF